ncbi:Lactosylceramide 1,3-N-acetyl-beta-D-glucosaminyltransferase A [Halotydeus destructor]|nr:Lactosylceramide 1,3-N-acetyl-beta-D-glucosaminyltransferase A [Halotydeus destructor]
MQNRLLLLCLNLAPFFSLSPALPDYVHLHTEQEVKESNYVLLNKEHLCDDEQLNQDLLIAIKTPPLAQGQRDAIRNSWLKIAEQLKVPHVFVIGYSTNTTIIDDLIAEDYSYHDLIVGKPVDNYYNLTLKAMFLMSWARTYCSNRWLLYVDDDTIVNVPNVLELIRRKDETVKNIFCRKLLHKDVYRHPASKWFVPKTAYPNDTYPDYCLGIGYLVPPAAIRTLHATATSMDTALPKLWIDDVFMTGMVTQSAGVDLVNEAFACCGSGGYGLYSSSLVLGEMGKGAHLTKMWADIEVSFPSTTTHPDTRTMIHNRETTEVANFGIHEDESEHFVNVLFAATFAICVIGFILIHFMKLSHSTKRIRYGPLRDTL